MVADIATMAPAPGIPVQEGWPEQTRIVHTAIPGPRSLARHAHRQQVLSTGLGTVLPVFVERAGGGILVDVDGNHLIDFASGIAVTTVGSSAPAVVRRVRDQVAQVTHTCFLVTEYDGYVEVGEKLNALTPGTHAKKSALFSTGAEAVENAVKIARVSTRRPAIVTFGHAYHGRTLLTMTMTAKNAPYKDGFGPFAPEVYRAPLAYPYRWPTGPERCATEALASLEDLVLKQIGAHNTAAIVIEPIQGEGGFIVPPAAYLQGVADAGPRARHRPHRRRGPDRDRPHRSDVRLRARRDRPRHHRHRQGLAGGLPLSGVTGRAELMDAVPPGGLGGTFAGNPVACAAALGVFETMEQEDLRGRARQIEALARPMLEEAAAGNPWVGEMRGRGAMLAVEFVIPGTKDPAPDAAAAVMAKCHRQGVVTLQCGTYGNVIRLLPPLVMPDDLLHDGLAVLIAAWKGL